ncbi:MAG: adenosylcobinamide-GDP ribazoletransferase [Clostridia bacterium]|nr:adenosylcobinamide-GDP ribazoletransferase [Clostridia bacterium]
MKTFFETILVAFGMFSRVPVPQVEWNEKNRKYSMLAFPLVGLVLGFGWVLLASVCRHFGLPELLTGALLTALPVLLVGGIHLDGYADAVDALSSHGDKEKKLAIMKDPHVGSFAVIHLVIYFLLWFAACPVLSEKSFEEWLLVGLTFVLSRSLSGLAVATFPMAKDTGLAKSFADDADKKSVRNGLVVVLVLLGLLFMAMDIVGQQFPEGFFAVMAAVAVFFWYRYIAQKHFEGINGDLAGWFLCKCEVWMLVAVAVAASLS